MNDIIDNINISMDTKLAGIKIERVEKIKIEIVKVYDAATNVCFDEIFMDNIYSILDGQENVV